MPSFDGQAFTVYPVGRRGGYPRPEWDRDAWHYRATVRVADLATFQALQSRITRVSTDPILGMTRSFVHIDGGVAGKSLVVPSTGGANVTYKAYLVEMSGTYGGGQGANFDVSVDFLIPSLT